MFYDKLAHLCKEKGISPSAAALAIGVSKSNVTKWKSGQTPKLETLNKLSSYFEVPVSYFFDSQESLCENKKPVTESDELNNYLDELRSRPEMRLLFSITKDCTKEEVEQAVKIIEALRK